MTRSLAKNLFRFLLVGGLNTGLVYLAFKLLLAFGAHYLVAGAIGWAVGVGASYGLNRSFTFEVSHKPHAREVGAFVGTYVIQLVIGQIAYWLLMGVAKLNADVAFVCNWVVVASISFVLMKWFVFRQNSAA